MFVLQKKYDKVLETARKTKYQLEILLGQYHALLQQYNNMVHRINKLGGEEFLNKAKIPNVVVKQEKQFDAEEIKRLIQLCHPDKHNGKPMAVEMTARLVKMRG